MHSIKNEMQALKNRDKNLGRLRTIPEMKF